MTPPIIYKTETIDYTLGLVIGILVSAIIILFVFFIFTNRLILKRQYFLRSKALDKMQVLISFDLDNEIITFKKFFTTKIKINQDIFNNKMTLNSFKQAIIKNQQSQTLLNLYNKITLGTSSQEDFDIFLHSSFNHQIIFFSIDEVTTAKIKINNFNFDPNTRILKCNTIITTFPNEFAMTIANINERLLSPRRIFLNIKKDIKKSKTKKLALIAINLDENFLEGILYSNIIDFFISFSNFIKKNGYKTYNQNDFTIYIADHGSKFVKNPKQLLNKWAIIIEDFKNEWEEEIGINSVEMKFLLTGIEGTISNSNDLLEMLSKIKYELYLNHHNDDKKITNLNYSKMIKNFTDYRIEILKLKSNSIILRSQSVIRNKDFFILNPNLSYEQQYYLNNIYYNSNIIWEKLVNRAILIANKNSNNHFIFKIPKNIIFQLIITKTIIPKNLFLTLELNDKLGNANFIELYLIQNIAHDYNFSLIVDKPIKFNGELITNFGTKSIFLTSNFLKRCEHEYLYDKTYNELTIWSKNDNNNHLFFFK